MGLGEMRMAVVWLAWHAGVWGRARGGPTRPAGAGHKDLCASSKPSGSPGSTDEVYQTAKGGKKTVGITLPKARGHSPEQFP